MLCESFSFHFSQERSLCSIAFIIEFSTNLQQIIIRIKPILSNIIGTLGLSIGKANKYNFNNKVPT